MLSPANCKFSNDVLKLEFKNQNDPIKNLKIKNLNTFKQMNFDINGIFQPKEKESLVTPDPPLHLTEKY